MITERDDKLIQKLMSKSSVEMPFNDFEDKLMSEIYLEEKRSKSFFKSLKLSWLFFIIGTGIGIFITTFIYRTETEIYGLSSKHLVLIAQVIFAILILSQFDKLMQLTRRKR